MTTFQESSGYKIYHRRFEYGGPVSGISPIVIYKVTNPPASNEPCQDAINSCSMFASFRWQGRKSCQARIYCPTLEGNICGSYGIRMRHFNFEKKPVTTHDICYKGELVSVDVQGGEYISLEYWYLDTVEKQAETKCYVWCNSNGNLPVLPVGDDQVQGQIEELKVSPSFSLKQCHSKWLNFFKVEGPYQVIDLKRNFQEINHQRVDISPNKIYELVEKGDSCINSTICRDQITFHWHHDSICKSSFFCPKLDGNVCGDFGITVNYGPFQEMAQYAATVCYQNFGYKGQMVRRSFASMHLVYKEHISYNATCYFWCTESGEPPAPTPIYQWTNLVENILVRNRGFASSAG